MAKGGSKSMLKGLTRKNPSGTPTGGVKGGKSVNSPGMVRRLTTSRAAPIPRICRCRC